MIGQYLTAAVLIGIALELNGLHGWVATGWRLAEDPVFTSDKKQTPPDGQGSTLKIKSSAGKIQSQWKRRRRPLLETLGLMAATHAIGYIALLSITSAPIVHALEVKMLVTRIFVSLIPHAVDKIILPPNHRGNHLYSIADSCPLMACMAFNTAGCRLYFLLA